MNNVLELVMGRLNVNKKIMRYICISLVMIFFINFQILQVQAGTTKVILHKTEQQSNTVQENEKSDGLINTGDDNHAALYLVSLMIVSAVCGRKIKKIKTEEEV